MFDSGEILSPYSSKRAKDYKLATRVLRNVTSPFDRLATTAAEGRAAKG